MFGDHISERLSAYVQSELPPEEYRRVAEHLLHCQRCRSEYEAIRLGAQLAAKLTPSEAPASLWHDLEALLEREEDTSFTAEAQRKQRQSRGMTEASVKPLRHLCVLCAKNVTERNQTLAELNLCDTSAFSAPLR